MREDIRDLLTADKDLSIETVDELDNKILATNFFENMANDVDAFDKIAWENKTGYDTPSFPSFTEGLEGWSPGFYCFAGAANMGKTAIMLNIMEDLCMNPDNKLFGIYFSLDDSKNRVIPRIVAMRELIPINIVSKPGRFQQMIEDGHPDSLNIAVQLDKREEGLQKLKTESNKLAIFDSQEIRTIDDIYEKARQVYTYIKAIDEDMNIVIGIDSLKDIEIPDIKLTTNERIDMVAKKIKDLSIELNCITFASMHLRKLNGNRRPTMDDLKDSNTLEYELDACFLVYNDVSKNKQGAKIFYRDSDDSIDKKPIIEIDWGKNKISAYKGITFCNFAPDYSKCIECSPDASMRYNALIYEV